MNAPGRLAAYAVALAVVFGGAAAIADAVVPESAVAAWQQRASHDVTPAATADDVRGLAIAQDGYQLTGVDAPTVVGRPGELTLRIAGRDGIPLTRYAQSHGKQLHLIVVRTDGTNYRHVHPVNHGDGSWSLPWTWSDAGSYRVFADFVPADGAADQNITLTRSVEVAGDYVPRPAVDPVRTATVDGFEVTITGDLRAQSSSTLTLHVKSKGGQPVTTLEPYLGAFGHLVALRDGDLAYLHVHPEGDEPGPGARSGPTVSFMTEAPTAGRYLLYFDFQVDGTVHTARFVLDAAPGTTEQQPSQHNQHR